MTTDLLAEAARLHELARQRAERMPQQHAGRRGPPCQHLNGKAKTIPAGWLACGCGSVTLRLCRQFGEWITERPLTGEACDSLARLEGEYRGRTCHGCHCDRQTVAPLPIPDGSLTQQVARGIVTGASAVHWPCLGANAIAAHRDSLGLAVADHGLAAWQRDELTRIGVRWIEHDRPPLGVAQAIAGPPADPKAWWKPWVCLASPFDRNVWVDSDAVVTGDVTPLLAAAGDWPRVSTEKLWQPSGEVLYRELVATVFGGRGDEHLPGLASINSGVMAWQRGDPLLVDWRDWCERLMQDAELVRFCRVRDQAGLLVALVSRCLCRQVCGGVRLLGSRWNVPADWLPATESPRRRPVSLEPARLLAETRERHPGAVVVHWLGGVKPWTIRG